MQPPFSHQTEDNYNCEQADRDVLRKSLLLNYRRCLEYSYLENDTNIITILRFKRKFHEMVWNINITLKTLGD